MHGLVAYDDDSQSDSEKSSQVHNDKELKIGHKPSADLRRTGKSQIIIKRPSNIPKNHPRVPLLGQVKGSTPETSSSQSQSRGRSNSHSASSNTDVPPERTSDPEYTPGQLEDNVDRIRALLRPPPIAGLQDWGIPPPSTAPCNPAIQTKLAQFSTLKHDPHNPKHFNDSLMSNRSFRNPHLYAKLVEFVDVDERVSNFPKDIWDPEDVQEDWFADKIAEQQKFRAEQQATAQISGKRTSIPFTSSSSSTSISVPLPSMPRAQRGERDSKSYGHGGSGYGGGLSHQGQEGHSSGVLGGGKRLNRYQPYGVGGQSQSHHGGQGGYSSRTREKARPGFG